jgi:pSer/pThr/pTyr-binding forkhead associated (FHA) protein
MTFLLRYGQRDYPLDQEEFLIGRSMSCQLPLDDPLVSRAHAALRVAADGVCIEDLGSRNGVKVNGDRIVGKRDLSHGDRVNIGKQEMSQIVIDFRRLSNLSGAVGINSCATNPLKPVSTMARIMAG